MHPYGRSVAVIGSGVAGLVASYALSARNRVTLFEADTRIGGHAHTHYVDRGDGYTVGVDSAFLVHNDRTYPTLCRLFAELGVASRETDMSMSVRDDGSGLEYAGARGIGGLFPSWSSLTRPRYLLMLAEIKRFHAAATRLLQSDGDGCTLGVFLDRQRFSRYFVDHFMTPLVAAVWSCPPGDAMRYPARYLFVFLEHHGMLSVSGSPKWRTVYGGSANYVEAILTRVDEVRAGDAVTSVRRIADGVQITTDVTRVFDAAVIATHPDQALLMLAEPTHAERAVLGVIPYCTNHAQLHTDESVLPRHRRARASWNYLATPNGDGVLVTYDVTRLMRLDGPRRFLVTLGGRDHVDQSTVLAEMTYSHPVYTPESVAAQQLLPTLDDDRLAFAGAYHGWGFHEDGAASGLRAARRLGAQWPTVARRAEVVAC
ncbi:MAG TPA: FAD-dependent oxidoreductase [Mycobacterium sp.]|jgi:predicted NAD/FAD-binding protein|nr:FAD-dependent oxidoreductase [Mycobacterium sp.]HEX4588050.1 FAD-dependent oxidoreductase [Mycobacterium sp.]